ncbi:hypothetical protein FLK61_25945 [Paenalkalicoccus suaedae]|uniref:Uncharacterized protein n=1 Tax=Paenalkalicoccus suaedae TaxID=2592382 RepID=A0A859FB25_9BACI|nr:hypothetical protein [Paenalkalicoccus suaedae]QKS70207.1 hypothetical protein FLK61_25945 [Paenalkalicoccus suaedae]
MERTVYFSDNFFSSGKTDIFNEDKERVGELDLKGAFSSSVRIETKEGNVLEAAFPFFSMKWRIKLEDGTKVGEVKYALSFSKKRYTYTTSTGEYDISAPAFSRSYTIKDTDEQTVAIFDRVSGFFSAPSYKLVNESDYLTTEELIAVVMGVNAIEKASSNNSHTPTP